MDPTEIPAFLAVRNNYLAMLSQPQHPQEEYLQEEYEYPQQPLPTTVSPAALSVYCELPAIGTPEYHALGQGVDFGSNTNPIPDLDAYAHEPLFDMDEYLTSPLSLAGDDFDADPAPTPADTPYSAFMPTPLMDGDLGADFELAAPSNGEAPVVATASANEPPPALDFTGLLALPADEFLPEETAKELPQTYTQPQPQTSGKLAMYTPTTPMLDSFDDDGFGYSPTSSRGSAPVIPPPPPTHSRTTRATTRSVPGATGTRKNITPAQLIPDDAPTQKRVYLTASATSRRTVSSSGSKRRTHAAAFADDEDGGEQLTSRELDALAAKRRQNTLAARKSRRRKLEHTQALEARVEELEREVVVWKERAGMVRAMLEARGVPVGGFEDEE